MSPEEFAGCLHAIGWTHAEFARRLGIAERSIRRMANGQMPVPPRIASWLLETAAFHNAHPMPQRQSG